jgi:hypothetical protein
MKIFVMLAKATIKAKLTEEAYKSEALKRLKLTDEQISGVLGWAFAQIDKI